MINGFVLSVIALSAVWALGYFLKITGGFREFFGALFFNAVEAEAAAGLALFCGIILSF